jgi:hypothetical protein
MVQVIVRLSPAALLIVENTVRQSMVPAEEALNSPASTSAPVPTPAPKVQMATMVLVDGL